ncbi:hypothetical protein [Acinetobacter sp. ASP199]|uniref:hypothetical protein n=1 Tax=unclassified Acinetobacter TaxID=196816 RepID=UPI001F60AB87|nr:hypothetical protein [Acinetobacter sp. ASP199]UNT57928.1 hypothetical protein IHE35_07150 [Acinetobacter sp. ASP199]
MPKKLEEHLQARSMESQKRILQKAHNLFNKKLQEDFELLKFAEQAQTDETVKLSIEELRTRVQNNAN